jgi:hypothetical protein
VQNGPEVSVSLSINFHYHDALLADVYRANYWLRKLGVRPGAPRKSPLLDAVKSGVYRSVRVLHGGTRRLVTR